MITVRPRAFPAAPAAYDRRDQDDTRHAILRALGRAYAIGEDIRIGYPHAAPTRLILADSVTGAAYNITVVSGTLTATAL